jgi:hypothetical protein
MTFVIDAVDAHVRLRCGRQRHLSPPQPRYVMTQATVRRPDVPAPMSFGFFIASVAFR